MQTDTSIFRPVFRFALRQDLVEDKRFLPARGEPFATGWDCRSAQPNKQDIILRAGQYFRIPLGFRAFPPEGWWFELHPRSSSFVKKAMHAHIGIIDEHFGFQETMMYGQYIPDVNSLGKDLVIGFGDRIAQIVPVRRVEMEIEEITNEEQDRLCAGRNSVRTGGIGSTG